MLDILEQTSYQGLYQKRQPIKELFQFAAKRHIKSLCFLDYNQGLIYDRVRLIKNVRVYFSEVLLALFETRYQALG